MWVSVATATCRTLPCKYLRDSPPLYYSKQIKVRTPSNHHWKQFIPNTYIYCSIHISPFSSNQYSYLNSQIQIRLPISKEWRYFGMKFVFVNNSFFLNNQILHWEHVFRLNLVRCYELMMRNSWYLKIIPVHRPTDYNTHSSHSYTNYSPNCRL